MARLLIKTAGIENPLIELKLGANRIGRSPETDFPITHPTISSLHCEVVLMEEGLVIRDLESTNGTFVDGRPVREAKLSSGQMVRLGDVELFVENTEFKVAIPKFIDMDLPAPRSSCRMDHWSARAIQMPGSPTDARIARKSCASLAFTGCNGREAGPFCSFARFAATRWNRWAASKSQGKNPSSRAWVKPSK